MSKRDLFPALLRGARSRCPRCGDGPLFAGFLAVSDHCAQCGEALHHHRADDAPPYVVMFIVGHVVVGAMLAYEIAVQPALWLHAAIFLPLTIVLSLVLLRPVKGSVVALQWAKRMHGFDSGSHRGRGDAA